MRDVRVTHGCHHPLDDREGCELYTPFNADFVNELKDGVPWEKRSWNSEDKVWWVSSEWAEFAEDLVVHHFGETIVVDEDGAEEYRDGHGTSARQERFL